MARASDYIHNGWVGGTIYYSFDFVGEWRFTPNSHIQDSDGIVRLGELSAHWQERFEAAMDEWEAVANIRFVETTRPHADLFIGWYSFDGQYGTAGDASGVDLDGDGRYERSNNEGYVVRMDPDDTSVFFKVAVHELGHVLGLNHIEHTPSIMSVYITGRITPTSYDAHAIQELYGPPTSSPPRTSDPDPDRPIFGTDGDDSLTGTAGADEIHGGNGSDRIFGGVGDDTLFGNIGSDFLDGGDGDDLIFAGQNDGPLRVASDGKLRHLDGIDTVLGGNGDDTLCGQYGNDILHGEDGDDVLFGGQNDDSLAGEGGNDVLAGNRGDDWLLGGGGNDRFYFGHNSGNDMIGHAFESRAPHNRDAIYIQADVNGSGIRDSHDVLARISDNAHGWAVIDLGAGNSITIWEHGASWFVASDFVIYG